MPCLHFRIRLHTDFIPALRVIKERTQMREPLLGIRAEQPILAMNNYFIVWVKIGSNRGDTEDAGLQELNRTFASLVRIILKGCNINVHICNHCRKNIKRHEIHLLQPVFESPELIPYIQETYYPQASIMVFQQYFSKSTAHCGKIKVVVMRPSAEVPDDSLSPLSLFFRRIAA